MSWNENWPTQAVCKDDDPDALFVQGAAQQQAKAVCFRCPVRAECLAHALDTRTEFGVWGGMTERERRQVLRRNPDVASWRDVFVEAMHNLQEAAGAETGSPRLAAAGGDGVAAGAAVPPRDAAGNVPRPRQGLGALAGASDGRLSA